MFHISKLLLSGNVATVERYIYVSSVCFWFAECEDCSRWDAYPSGPTFKVANLAAGIAIAAAVQGMRIPLIASCRGLHRWTTKKDVLPPGGD
jgi:hypothetical protein